MYAGSSTTSDHVRANWTPSQDNFFIDLMLEQVSKGNKTGHGFRKQAWADMIVLFNNEFGFKYDTDILKNRYKRLRKQYSEMKSLVDQGNFRWDETQQMITADDDVWNNYIKLLMEDTVFHVTIWTLRTKIMDQFFVELMLDEVRKGNKVGCTFKKKSWITMITCFNEKFGFQHGRAVLKNRYNVLRKHYSSVNALLDQKGFTWDETQQKVVADDPVWNKYIEAHPSFHMYRNKAMPYYSDLCVICGNEARLLKEVPSNCNEALDKGTVAKKIDGDATPIVDKQNVQKKALDSSDVKNLSDQKERHSHDVTQTLHQSKKPQRTDGVAANALGDMAVAESPLKKKLKKEASVSIEKVIDVLKAIPDIDDDLLLDAVDLLEDEKRARMFLALHPALRKKWLMRKLRPQ
ncbi:L10-interacting MYB domain-containing protein-like isoform X3 [Malus domestica]|uniref:L10-interacting MYB domain-containing protein-like isoform X3 n=1 Tax=Malus domestica TaxID=3750 RepID=UPI00397705E1